MKMSRISILLLTLFFITLCKVSLAQIEIDAEQQVKYEELTKELDYSDTRNKWVRKEKEKREKEPKKSDRTFNPTINIDGGFTNAIAYLLIVGLLVAVFFMIFSNVSINKRIDIDQDSTDYIEDIEEVDTLDGFKQALLAGDYRSAIRMQFIKVLQLLQEKNHIKWKPEKTNRDYLRELSGKTEKNNFRKLSGIYELVWYGNTKIEKESFEQLNPSFEKFINDFDAK